MLLSEIETEIVSITQVLKLFEINRTTLWKWEQRGLIHRIPGTKKFTRAEVARFLGEYTAPPTPEQRRRGPYKRTREMNATRRGVRAEA
mgnify:CR=1 FL=1